MELRIEQLSFEYAGHPLFSQFNLTLGAGITWLRGENGAGKTTLMKLAGGALTPHSGHIWLNGMELRAQPLAYRLQCYYCGGDTPALPWLTVREMLDMHVSLYTGADPALLNAELAAFHLLPVLDQPVTTLSLGQHKKMQLALALALPVGLLLIDEPFNGLDVDAVAYLRQQLAAPERLARQCILLTSHVAPQLPLARTVDL
ncbi:ABC-2 type transport system ATP-binding protein [Duganella sp. 1224]|uniref:ABC transporter ATP-binding protein n=1 Tax=Duganella sp. 1224 TaxID=2587052 RepID=UPI0015C796A2|nr:ATP-binding cassette domain-containing protein [Duganella sp. 1224]NYE62727.1 ABC-2 type transport system ATP-binding protein [Duganella sp. 1224]